MTVIDERLTAKGFTPRNSVPLVYGMPRTIDFYTIHHWGAFGQTHDGVNNFFANGPGATSAHFVSSANRLNCLVNPWDAAWHAGNAYGNAQSVGIECRPEGSDADYATTAELLRFLWDTYGRKPLRPHRYWQATACPGAWDLARLEKMAVALGSTPAPAKPKPIAPKPATVGDDMKVTHERLVVPSSLVLAKGQELWLRAPDNKTNWNLATEGLAYYDVDMFLRGTGLLDGESVTVQPFIVTSGNHRSGYFPQEIHGSTDGIFAGQVRFKTPLLSTGRVEVLVKSSAPNVKITSYGADTFAFSK